MRSKQLINLKMQVSSDHWSQVTLRLLTLETGHKQLSVSQTWATEMLSLHYVHIKSLERRKISISAGPIGWSDVPIRMKISGLKILGLILCVSIIKVKFKLNKQLKILFGEWLFITLIGFFGFPVKPGIQKCVFFVSSCWPTRDHIQGGFP